MNCQDERPVAGRIGQNLKQQRLVRPMLALLLAAGCSPAMENRSAATDQTEHAKRPGQGELKLPNEKLAAKHKAAKDSPQSFEAVYAYARALTEFYLASLVETKCDSCKDGAVKHKPPSELDTQTWSLIEEAVQMLAALLKSPDLSATQAEQLVITKGRLHWLAGNATDEEATLDSYLQDHPDSLTVLKRRLKLLREAGNASAAQALCARSRASMKAAPEAAHLDLLTTCVALHPGNREGVTDPPDYTQYLPDPSKAEERLYRKHLVQRCIENLGDPKASCDKACACKDKPGDKEQKRTCKHACRECEHEKKEQVRACKKSGGVVPAPAPPDKAAPAEEPKKAHGKTARGRQTKDVEPGSEPQATEL